MRITQTACHGGHGTRKQPGNCGPWSQLRSVAADTDLVDRHLRWLRSQVVRSIVAQTARWFVASVVILCVAVLVQGGLRIGADASTSGDSLGITTTGRLGNQALDAFDAMAVLIGAQLIVALRLVAAIEFNPLNRRYLTSYGDTPQRFRAVRADGDMSGLALELPAYGLHPVVSVGRVDDEPSMVFDLHQSVNRLVTVAVGRLSGSITVLTELDDRRIVVTADAALLPHELIVANAKPSATLTELLASHRRLLQAIIDGAPLQGRAAKPIGSSPEVFVRHIQLEQAAFQCIGPVVGSFCDLTGRRFSWRLRYRLDPAAMLGLSLDCSPTDDGKPRFDDMVAQRQAETSHHHRTAQAGRSPLVTEPAA